MVNFNVQLMNPSNVVPAAAANWVDAQAAVTPNLLDGQYISQGYSVENGKLKQYKAA